MRSSVRGGAGWDTVSYYGATANITGNLATHSVTNPVTGENDTVFNIEALTGGFGNDTLIGDANNNNLTGRPGNDSLDGGGGVPGLGHVVARAHGRRFGDNDEFALFVGAEDGA